MERIKVCLIGDSNLCQYAFPEKETARAFLGAKEVHIVRATVFTAFRTAFNEVGDANCVVISALLNHVSDLERKWTDVIIDEEKANEITEMLSSTAKLINEFAKNNPRTRTLVIPPIYRASPKWLQDNMTLIKETFPNLLGAEVIYLNPFEINDDELKADGVHLKDRTIQRLKTYVKESISTNMGKERENRKRQRTNEEEWTNEIEDDMSDRQLLLRNSRILENIESKLFKTDQNIEELEKKLSNNINQNLVQNARLCERIDGMENRTRRNLVVIRLVKVDSNVKIPDIMRERADFILSFITLEINKLEVVEKPTVNIRSIFLIPAGGGNNYLQDLRLTCGSTEDAVEIRLRLLKAKERKIATWSEVEISNDPVKSTRVRIALLQAVARQINRSGDQEAVVTKYIDSPTLIIRSGGRIIKNISFVDTILQYGSKISPEDMEKAKKIAGRSYINQMESTFLILKESDNEVVIPIPSGTYIAPTRGTGFIRGRGRGSWRGRGSQRGRPIGQVVTNAPNNTGNSWASVVTGANREPIQQASMQNNSMATAQLTYANLNQNVGYMMIPQSQSQETTYAQQQQQVMRQNELMQNQPTYSTQIH